MPRPSGPPATRRRSRSEAFAKALAKALAKAKASCGLLGGVLVSREFLAGSLRHPQDLENITTRANVRETQRI